MLLAERVASSCPGELDPRDAGPGADIHNVADREALSVGLTLDDRVGPGELQHRVGMQVEHEPAAEPKPAAHSRQRRAQFGGSEIVEAVEGRNRRVEHAADHQVRKGLLDQDRVRAN